MRGQIHRRWTEGPTADEVNLEFKPHDAVTHVVVTATPLRPAKVCPPALVALPCSLLHPHSALGPPASKVESCYNEVFLKAIPIQTHPAKLDRSVVHREEE